MIKLIIFDLDGVLIDARDIHYEALNRALAYIDPKYQITREEHLAKYDGLPTRKKLQMLTNEKGLPEESHTTVWRLKQSETQDVIRSTIKENPALIECMKSLCGKYKIHCASNSVDETVYNVLKRLGILQYFDLFVSNEKVKNPKPHAEMYLKCMVDAGVNPKETLIIEDSHIGRLGAFNSGGHVMGVLSTADVTYENIKAHIDRAEETTVDIKPKWQGGRMNVLIPMAGAGSRFEQAGYTFPKPLIDVMGKPMIQVVTENLNIDARHIYIVQKSHYVKYNLKHMLNLISPKCEIVQVDGITEGAACTTLLAKQFIDSDAPLVIANSDQYVEWNSNEFLYAMQSEGVDAGILTFKSVHPKWSYVRLDENGWVVEVAEKKPISDNATVGIYYWKYGADYVRFAEEMIRNDVRVNNEFYVCPVFNEALRYFEDIGEPYNKVKIKPYPIEKMWGLGTPEDLEIFRNEFR